MNHLTAVLLISGIYLANTASIDVDRYPKVFKDEEFSAPKGIAGSPWPGKDVCTFNNVAYLIFEFIMHHINIRTPLV